MNNKILVVGFACLSLAAVAQSNGDKQQAPSSASVTTPRDAATGQASGKRMHKPITVTAEVGVDATSKDAAKPTNKSAADDWSAKSVPSNGTPAVKRVATGDVNGDGKVTTATEQSSGKATGKSAVSTGNQSSVQSPRDLATGHASGKQAQEAPAPAKSSDAAPKK